MRKIIFLDRDDTIIEDKVYLNDPSNIDYIPESFEAFNLLKENYEFIVVTNQSGVAKGIVSLENLEEIHRRIQKTYNEKEIKILDFFYAPYPSGSDHPLRKPNPGMLLEAKKKYQIEMSQSWMIGNRMSDVEAGHRAGCKSILYLHNGEREATKSLFLPADFETPSLIEAARFILNN